MKKIFVILVALMGFGISANAQMCEITKGVEPSFTTYSGKLYIKLVNTNDYKVTVDVTATIVLKDGKTKPPIKRTVIIDATTDPKNQTNKEIATSITNDDVDKDASSVSLTVSKCK
ncbi:MAG: hypothetical protein LBM08_04365 [Dysgonamonadaceae bacterium]|nr:hypothetical protein [Dysgonamonadaceae bacterium]